MSEVWIYAYVRGDKNNKVKVRQCAAGSEMFVSDTEDYYKVTELEFAPMDVDPSDPLSGLKKVMESIDPVRQQRILQRDKLSFFWAEQRVEIMKLVLQRRMFETPDECLELTDMMMNRLYEQNDKFQERLLADLR
jgi:hypothetical protein